MVRRILDSEDKNAHLDPVVAATWADIRAQLAAYGDDIEYVRSLVKAEELFNQEYGVNGSIARLHLMMLEKSSNA